jgi:phosphoribosylglycinamide formyltransferase-1
MRAIVEAIEAGRLDAEARLVVSNNSDSFGLEFARKHGLPTRHVSGKTEGSPQAEDHAIAEAMTAAGVELIVLSGYMKKLGPETLRRFSGRVLNIHPAYLPHHGGRGMYGRRVHEAVHRSGATFTGATIHVVDEEYDRGPHLRRRRVAVKPGHTVDDIEANVRKVEAGLYLQVLREIARRNKQVMPKRRRKA